jgi:hypothetical protein
MRIQKLDGGPQVLAKSVVSSVVGSYGLLSPSCCCRSGVSRLRHLQLLPGAIPAWTATGRIGANSFLARLRGISWRKLTTTQCCSIGQ